MTTEYWVVKCPGCGNIQTKQINNPAKAVFKCVYCDKGRKLKLVREWGLSIKVLFKSTHPGEAAHKCTQLKAEEHKCHSH